MSRFAANIEETEEKILLTFCIQHSITMCVHAYLLERVNKKKKKPLLC